MNDHVYLVEFTNNDGDTSGHLIESALSLSNFVRVNAEDLGSLRIISVSKDLLARDHVAQVMGRD